MRFFSTYFLIFIILCGCKNENNDNLECNATDRNMIFGIWSNPEFASNSSNCFSDECLEISFKLNTDYTYQLEYHVYVSATDSILRAVDDQGVFEFNCVEAGQHVGSFSSLRFVAGDLILNSEDLPQAVWDLTWSGVEGLIISPEYLGFSHDVYIKLK